MNALSRLWAKLSNKGYREAFVGAQIKRMVPAQIRALRKQRDWTQADLANAAKLTQGVISRAEDPDYGNLTINTLVRIAGGFDVAFIGRFVPFSELGKWYTNLGSEQSLMVPSFGDDTGFIERRPPTSEGIQIVGPSVPAYESRPRTDKGVGIYKDFFDRNDLTGGASTQNERSKGFQFLQMPGSGSGSFLQIGGKRNAR